MPAAKKPKLAKPTASLPADLAAALAKSPKAKAAFAALPASHQREYTKWIDEAKRAETRTRRIEQTLARLAAGKSFRAG